MEKLRVVLIRSNPVKPYPRLEKTANALLKAGYSVKVLAWDRSADYKAREEILTLPNGEVPIVRAGIKGEFSAGFKKNLFPLLKFERFIYSWLSKHRNEYDVIHAYDFDTGFTAKHCAKRFKKPLIYDIPDYYADSHALGKGFIRDTVRRCENNVINSADGVLICTDKRKEQIAGTSPKRLVVLHNTPYDKQCGTFDESEFSFSKDKLKLAYIGIFGRARFLDKIAEVVQSRDDCEFHIGGFGASMERYFEELSAKDNRIKYYGRTSYDKTLYIEQNCDIICAMYDPKVPNHHYAAPNKFYEAMMLGKPIIMVKNTGMDEIVSRQNTGKVIDYTAESLDKALTELISERDKFDEMGKKARALYDEQFSWSVMEKRLLDLYKEIQQIDKRRDK